MLLQIDLDSVVLALMHFLRCILYSATCFFVITLYAEHMKTSLNYLAVPLQDLDARHLFSEWEGLLPAQDCSSQSVRI